MAFYFALLNVSKKDNTQERQPSSSHRRHRRHSIASVESPLLDYRLLPRPQLLSDDVVITNELAEQLESTPTEPAQSTRLSERRSRGSARASKWVQENHKAHMTNRPSQQNSLRPSLLREPLPIPPSSSRCRIHRNSPERNPCSLSRSQRAAFEMERKEANGDLKNSEKTNEEKSRKRMGRGGKMEEQKRGERQSEEEEHGKSRMKARGRGRRLEIGEDSSRNDGQEASESVRKARSDGNEEQSGMKMDDWRTKEPVKTMRRGIRSQHPISGIEAGTSKSYTRIPSRSNRELLRPSSKFGLLSASTSSPSNLSPSNRKPRYTSSPVSAANGVKSKVLADHSLMRSSAVQMTAGSSATDESGRSSSQMSNESATPRRDDSPASSCDPNEQEVIISLSAVSMSSRSSEPRLKKVTFESSPYVISNSFLGDGAGQVLVVRRGSGTAVRRVGAMDNGWNPPKVLIEARGEEVSGNDWWTHCGRGEEQEALNDNQLNKHLEKGSGGKRSILRRVLIRRRSTSDKTQLLAYRNSGFLSSSEERKSESASASRMTVSVDRPAFNNL